MSNDEMFAGFSVAAGNDRFGEHIKLGGEPNDCKLSAQDTNGAVAVFEFSGSGGGPRHLHRDQDEWIYIIEGQLDLEVASKRFRAGAGEFVFIPRQVPHGWARASGGPVKIINTYQPAGTLEEFFRELGKHVEPQVHEALSFDELRELFRRHGMDVVGPPLTGEWKVEDGWIVQTA